ncbi:hypothetical protein DIS24_g1439 [Lasiodiplodia hormozganensis]|uniref:Uncharacterized protein n=1 Tax=Lasiodiplodia hormozganensis TaxID=869390 RepID=A0AA40D564_9PEZI|nr:hypothetical protein DIS24_g1439 [Lasiodiplodia hormozganensis]
MPDFIKLAIYGAFAPDNYDPDAYYVDKEDKKGKKNKDKDVKDKDVKDKDAIDNDDRSSLRSFETSESTIVEEKDGKTTTLHQEKEKMDCSKSPEISEGSSQSKSKSKRRRRVKLHDNGPSGPKAIFNSMFASQGHADGLASLKW